MSLVKIPRSSLKVSEKEKQLFRTYLTSSLKCAVSPGELKDEKLIAITRKLVGPGLIITPDDEHAAHTAECLNNASIDCSCVSLAEPPEENQAVVESCLSGTIKLLVVDKPCSENLPQIPFKYIVHLCLPQSPKEYVRDLRHCALYDGEKFAILLYNPGDRYLQEEIIKRKCEADPALQDTFHVLLAELDLMDEYAAFTGCRMRFLTKVLGLEKLPGECGNCDNCRKLTAEQSLDGIDIEKTRLLLRCIVETREKFGISVLTDILRGSVSKRIREYTLTKASTFGVLRSSRKKEIAELFNYLIYHGYIKRTTGTYPALYLTALGRKLMGNVIVHPLELPKKMTLHPDEKLDIALMEAVRNFRRSQAKLLNISAFMVFSDEVLKEIVKVCPQSEKELKAVKGFGEGTWRICGEGLLKVIRSYVAGSFR